MNTEEAGIETGLLDVTDVPLGNFDHPTVKEAAARIAAQVIARPSAVHDQTACPKT
jgi:hypothetical protein